MKNKICGKILKSNAILFKTSWFFVSSSITSDLQNQ